MLEAEYFVPYLAHAAMEPVNATAIVPPDGCEVWVGNQAPTFARWFAAKAADVDTDRVTIHTPYLGGGFGRRTEVDVVVQAVTIAKQVPGTPVQLVWSREEDLRHGVYRPMAAARMRAAALRELWEETGVEERHVTLIAQTREEVLYDLPEELLGKLWEGRNCMPWRTSGRGARDG